MKTKSILNFIINIGVIVFLFCSCSKKEAIKTVPTVTVSTVTNITATSASTGGNITSDGGATVISRGVCWSTDQNPTTSNSTTTELPNKNAFSSILYGLSPGTTYYLKAYATNSMGTGYSDQLSFATLANLPMLMTSDLTDITSGLMTYGGNISNDGGAPVTSRGLCWATTSLPTISSHHLVIGSGIGKFSGQIPGLSLGVSYFVRSYATNSAGTAYGDQVKTPAIMTLTPSSITAMSITSGGNIVESGGLSILERGICWSTKQDPTISDPHTSENIIISTYPSYIYGLTGNTTYYLRAYASGLQGVIYGDQYQITTAAGTPGIYSDIDGNLYHSVPIGNQVWMLENLKTTKFRDGTSIPQGYDNPLNLPAYFNYDDNVNNVSIYGRLYNFASASSSLNIAPVGWHVATASEITTLIAYLGGPNTAGGKLKEIGISYWLSPNSTATNFSGFTGRPGGWWASGGGFAGQHVQGFWWTSTGYNSSNGICYYLTYDSSVASTSNFDMQYFFSIRCVKD